MKRFLLLAIVMLSMNAMAQVVMQYKDDIPGDSLVCVSNWLPRVATLEIGAGAAVAHIADTNLHFAAGERLKIAAALTNAAEFATAAQGVSADAAYLFSQSGSYSLTSDFILKTIKGTTDANFEISTSGLFWESENKKTFMVDDYGLGWGTMTGFPEMFGKRFGVSEDLLSFTASSGNMIQCGESGFSVSTNGDTMFSVDYGRGSLLNGDVTVRGRFVSGYGNMISPSYIDPTSDGASQWCVGGYGLSLIGPNSGGATQRGYNDSATACWFIGPFAYGATQIGYNTEGNPQYASATNAAPAAVQLFCFDDGYSTTQHALTTAGGGASILLGAGVSSNKNAIVAGDGAFSHGNGSITATGGFWGNGANLSGVISTNSWPYLIYGSSVYGGTLVTDFNAILHNGYYSATADAVGCPVGGLSFYVQHINSNLSTNGGVQMAWSGESPSRSWIRYKSSGVWGSWYGGATAQEFGYMSGVTSGIQAQINAKASTASLVAATNALLSTSLPFTSVITPVNGTATVSVANGIQPYLNVTNATVIQLDPTGYATTGVARVSLSYFVSGTNSVTFATNVVTYAAVPTVATNLCNAVLFRRISNCVWKGAGL